MTGETGGRAWTGAELAVVVGDYVAQLEKTLAGKPVDRAAHGRAVRFVTGKSDAPIAWKQGEISAVLSLIGLPILKEQPPRWTYDEPLLEAVEEQLAAKPALLAAAVRPASLFVAPPAVPLIETPSPRPMAMTDRLVRLIQRFDMGSREADDRFLRGLGLSSVIAHEARRLSDRGRPDLAAKIRPAGTGDPAGCDILGFGLDETPRLIVVKTTLAGEFAPFGLTHAECALAAAQPEAFRIRRVYDLLGEARFYRMKPPFG
jgi:hypothetical protein